MRKGRAPDALYLLISVPLLQPKNASSVILLTSSSCMALASIKILPRLCNVGWIGLLLGVCSSALNFPPTPVPAPGVKLNLLGNVGEGGKCEASKVFTPELLLEGATDVVSKIDLGLVKFEAALFRLPNDVTTEIILDFPGDPGSSVSDVWALLKGLNDLRFSCVPGSVNPLPRLVKGGVDVGTVRESCPSDSGESGNWISPGFTSSLSASKLSSTGLSTITGILLRCSGVLTLSKPLLPLATLGVAPWDSVVLTVLVATVVLEEVSREGVREDSVSEMEGIIVSDSERLWGREAAEEDEGSSIVSAPGGVNEMVGVGGGDDEDF